MDNYNPEALRKYRKAKKLNQQALSEYLKIPLSTYSLKEREGSFDQDELNNIYKFFKIKKEDLFNLDSNDGNQEPDEKEFDWKTEFARLSVKYNKLLEKFNNLFSLYAELKTSKELQPGKNDHPNESSEGSKSDTIIGTGYKADHKKRK